MKNGAPIEIAEISNGVIIKPVNNNPQEYWEDRKAIAFQSAEDFIAWIKQHFSMYEQPKWDKEGD